MHRCKDKLKINQANPPFIKANAGNHSITCSIKTNKQKVPNSVIPGNLREQSIPWHPLLKSNNNQAQVGINKPSFHKRAKTFLRELGHWNRPYNKLIVVIKLRLLLPYLRERSFPFSACLAMNDIHFHIEKKLSLLEVSASSRLRFCMYFSNGLMRRVGVRDYCIFFMFFYNCLIC